MRVERVKRVVRVCAWLCFALAAAGPLGAPNEAFAAITTYTADHEIRLTSQQPFTTNTFSDFTSSPALDAAPYSRSEMQGFGQFEVQATQHVTVTRNSIRGDLSATMFDVGNESGGIASSKLELRFTLDAPARLFVSGFATGNDRPFSGGRSLNLTPVPGSFDDALIATSGLDAINYTSTIPRPIALSAGRYDLVLTSSLGNRAVGTRTNSAFLQFFPTDVNGGDFNGDGKVDAADYTVWRDGNSADISQSSYDLWADHFGATTAPPSIAVPESSASLLVTLALPVLSRFKRRRG